MTIERILISTDRVSMNSILQFDNPESSLFNVINLTLSSISENIDYQEDKIIVSWHDLKQGLSSLGNVLWKEQAVVIFDDYTKSLLNKFINDRNCRKLKKSFIELNDDEITHILNIEGFIRKLTPEQQRDVKKLLALRHGANFSVPGAGKTSTIIAVHTILKNLGVVDTLLVVSPINAFISWEDELREIFGDYKKIVKRLSIYDLQNAHLIEENNPDVILVNYEKTRRDIDHLFSLFQRKNIHLVLDEAHRIKGGRKNLSFSQLCQLADLSVRRDILTGTPMPQSFGDLNPQMELLWNEDILSEINKGDDEERIDEINNHLKGLFVRTTKKELGLPSPIIRYKYVEMGAIQRELYNLLKSEASRNLSNIDKNSARYFRHLGGNVVRLLQAATNPMLLGTEDEFYDETIPIPPDSEMWNILNEFSKYEKPAKVSYLRNRVKSILAENEDNKIVIWSYFVRNILLLERIFSDYDPVTIYGGIPTGDDEDENKREARIRKFHNDRLCRVLIANPQAGGEGISLHKVCHYAIYLDRTFNAAHYLQSMDRIHRLGLDKNIKTRIEILISKNTIDEVIIKRLNVKTENMARVLNDRSLLTLAYDPIDIDENFGLNLEDVKLIQEHISVND